MFSNQFIPNQFAGNTEYSRTLCARNFCTQHISPNVVATITNMLKRISLIFFLIMATTRLSNADAKTALNDVLVKNAKQYFVESGTNRSAGSVQTREQMCKILLNNANMKDLTPDLISDHFIANELNIPRRLVRTYRNNMTPLKDIKPAAKPKGLSKNHFIYKHNDLAQRIVKFWIEHSTPSPNKKDVVHKHSDRPGDHSRVKPGNGRANYIKCNYKPRCQTDQRRLGIHKL